MVLPPNSNLPGVTDFTGSNVTVTPSANFNLVLDIDLTSPSSPVYDLDSATPVRPWPADQRSGRQRHAVAGAPGPDLRRRHAWHSAGPATTTPRNIHRRAEQRPRRCPACNATFASNGWLGVSSPVTATISGQVNVSLPLSQTLSGSTSSVGTLTLTIANLGKYTNDRLPTTGASAATSASPRRRWAAHSPVTDLLGNDTGIIGALDKLSRTNCNPLLNTQLFGLDIPLVGNALRSADNFVQMQGQVDAMGPTSGTSSTRLLGSSAGSSMRWAERAKSCSRFRSHATAATLQIQSWTLPDPPTFTELLIGRATSLLPSAQNIQDVQFDFHPGRHLDASDLADLRHRSAWPGTSAPARARSGQHRCGPCVQFRRRSQQPAPISSTPTSGLPTDRRPECRRGRRRHDHRAAWLPGPDRDAAGIRGDTDPVSGAQALPTQVGLNFSGWLHRRRFEHHRRRCRRSPSARSASTTCPVCLTSRQRVSRSGPVARLRPQRRCRRYAVSTLHRRASGRRGARRHHERRHSDAGRLDLRCRSGRRQQHLARCVAEQHLARSRRLPQQLPGQDHRPAGRGAEADPAYPRFPRYADTDHQRAADPGGRRYLRRRRRDFSSIVSFVDAIVDFVGDLGASSSLSIPLGNFNLDQFDLRQMPGSGGKSIPDNSTPNGSSTLMSDLGNSSAFTPDPNDPNPLSTAEGDNSGFGSFMTRWAMTTVARPPLPSRS